LSSDYDGKGTPAMYLGTNRGGVWRNTNFKTDNPIWTPLIDNIGDKLRLPFDKRFALLDIRSIAIDIRHPRTIYVDTGDYFGFHYGGGILKSEDGGDMWDIWLADG
jgi:hypothetical protein